jgi:hypothetical protein
VRAVFVEGEYAEGRFGIGRGVGGICIYVE